MTTNNMLREALESIHRCGLDTLSGRIDGVNDRDWQRAAVNEMTKRARTALEFTPPLIDEGSASDKGDALSLGSLAVARDLLTCFEAREPQVCVLGNVRARDGADLMRRILARPQSSELMGEKVREYANSNDALQTAHDTMLHAIESAYGHLWHVNNEPGTPQPDYSPEKAAYAARKILRDLLTHEQRGIAINRIGRELGFYVDAATSDKPEQVLGVEE